MQRAYKLLMTSFIALLMLTGCETIQGITGAPAPTTANQRIFYSYGVAIEAEGMATHALNMSFISSSRARDIQASARIVKGSIDRYFATAAAGGKVDALAVLTSINEALISLETFLAQQGVPK